MKAPRRHRFLLLTYSLLSHHAVDAFAPSHRTSILPTAASTPCTLSAHSNRSDVSTSSSQPQSTEASSMEALRSENNLLKSRVRLLQLQNDELLRLHNDSGQKKREVSTLVEQRLILEDFEGEGRVSVDAMGRLVDGWDAKNKRYTEPWDKDTTNGEQLTVTQSEDEEDELGLNSDAMTAPEYEEEDETPSITSTTATSETSSDDLCQYNEQTQTWTTNNSDECPVEPNISFTDALKSRANWLVGLLALQSCSGFILARNEALLQDHPVIVYFLTMLVGAGGNAGNQASVRVIRGLALGTLNKATQSQFLSREFRMACALSTILSAAGFLRAIAFHTPFPETVAVTCALSLIVFSSICLGAVLPLFLQRLGVDPAHSSTTIQVIMDILGVVLTVFVSTTVLDSPVGKMLTKALGL